MFDFLKSNKKNVGASLSLSYYNERNKKSYEVCYESCEYNDYAKVKVLDEYCDKMNKRFKHWISNTLFDNMVGEALRNGFFSLKPLYQGDVKDNYKYVIKLSIGDKSHVVTDSFGAAPRWVLEFERLLMSRCLEEELTLHSQNI